MIYVGIDPTDAFSRSRRPMDLAVLGEDLKLRFATAPWPAPERVLERSAGEISTALCTELTAEDGRAVRGGRAVFAIDGPQGLAAVPPRGRMCERILRTPAQTPDELPVARDQRAFMSGYLRSSIDLTAALLSPQLGLRLAGLEDTPATEATLFEVYPGAEWPVFACGLLARGISLSAKRRRGGREQRRDLMRELGIRWEDPPELPTHDQLDAAMGAYLAWCSRHQPASVELVGCAPFRRGELREGFILHRVG